MPLPWSDELEKLLYEKNITREGLVRLWFDVSPETDSLFRYQYMNLVTDLYKKNFSMQLGQWCRAHNVEYIGHILEDNNSSSVLVQAPDTIFALWLARIWQVSTL